MNVGENLKRIRKDKGLTQEKLSELTKISITSIQRYCLRVNSMRKLHTRK